MSLIPRVLVVTGCLLLILIVVSPVSLWAGDDPWNAPAFSASPEVLRQAAAAITAEKDADATVLLSEQRFSFDAQDKSVETHYTIYRIENEEGVKGWAEIPPAKVDADAVEAAERANSIAANNFAIMHTVACLYADQGKTKEARELLLKAMDISGLAEPDSAVWLGLGKVAEQYGEIEAAQAMYARVEKPEVDGPGSNYSLAQQRMAELKTSAATVKSAGH